MSAAADLGREKGLSCTFSLEGRRLNDATVYKIQTEKLQVAKIIELEKDWTGVYILKKF